uniref:hypothetical protein n=1 Tax=Frankia sp. Cr1 TaxID=3073931 RepID=UPI002AD46474
TVILTDPIVAALTDVAAGVYGLPAGAQNQHIDTVAGNHRLDRDVLRDLARDIGTVVARSTRRRSDPTATGRPSYNALAGANLTLAVETHLARATLADLAHYSTPDMPRLWILANGLVHAVPPGDLLTVPATSHGPLARRILPTHDDLVGWKGVSDAVGHLDAILVTAQTGRAWIDRGMVTSREAVGRAIGIIDLTQPAVSYELAAAGPHTLAAGDIRDAVRGLPVPASVTDLSDQALKAACDRAGWLLGTADEHTQQIIVNRAIRAGLTDDIRTRLAAGDTTALATALRTSAPADDYLDKAAWPNSLYPADHAQITAYLGAASRHALWHFAGARLPDPPGRAEAIAARFPDQALRRQLVTTADQLRPDPPRPADAAGPEGPDLDFDL